MLRENKPGIVELGCSAIFFLLPWRRRRRKRRNTHFKRAHA
jgi:hypothetical protein